MALITVDWTKSTESISHQLQTKLGEFNINDSEDVKINFIAENGQQSERLYRISRDHNGKFDFNRIDGWRGFFDCFNFLKVRSRQSTILNNTYNTYNTKVNNHSSSNVNDYRSVGHTDQLQPHSSTPSLSKTTQHTETAKIKTSPNAIVTQSFLPGLPNNKGYMCYMNAGLKQLMIELKPNLSDRVEAVLPDNCTKERRELAMAFSKLSDTCYGVKAGIVAETQVISDHNDFVEKLTLFAKANKREADVDTSGLISQAYTLLFDETSLQQDCPQFIDLMLNVLNIRDTTQELSEHSTRQLDNDDYSQYSTVRISQNTMSLATVHCSKDKSTLSERVAEGVKEEAEYIIDTMDKSNPERIQPMTKTDRLSHPNPKGINSLRLQAVIYKSNVYGQSTKTTNMAQKLVTDDDVISLDILNSTNSTPVKCKFRIQSITVHSGSSMSGGHYYTLERDKDGSWIKHNDSHVSKLGCSLTKHFKRSKNEAPYTFVLEAVQ